MIHASVLEEPYNNDILLILQAHDSEIRPDLLENLHD